MRRVYFTLPDKPSCSYEKLHRLDPERFRLMVQHFLDELVMEALKSVDSVAYVRYASVYKDFHRVEDFREFIKDEHLGGGKNTQGDKEK